MKNLFFTSRIAWIAALVLGGTALPRPLIGQEGVKATPIRQPVTASPAQLLTDYTAEVHSRIAGNPWLHKASGDITHVLTRRDQYPARMVSELLSGLERLALESGHPRVRTEAAAISGTAGSRNAPNPMPGTVARLIRLYQRSQDPSVRRLIVFAMPHAAERAAAVAFVRFVALQDPENQDFPGAIGLALGTLETMDEEGRTVLRELHEKQLVKDPLARWDLENLAKRGYRIDWRPTS